jgi:hypothetical protein
MSGFLFACAAFVGHIDRRIDQPVEAGIRRSMTICSKNSTRLRYALARLSEKWQSCGRENIENYRKL